MENGEVIEKAMAENFEAGDNLLSAGIYGRWL